MTWREFLKAQWEALASTDLFTVEVWTGRGLVRYHVLFVIQLATRVVEIAGVVLEPTESWMLQIARNLVEPWTGFLSSSRLLIHDRATVFSEHFRQLLRSGRVESLGLPARSPNLNAYAERFVRTIRQECTDGFLRRQFTATCGE
jgi:transposase InsO family protein